MKSYMYVNEPNKRIYLHYGYRACSVLLAVFGSPMSLFVTLPVGALLIALYPPKSDEENEPDTYMLKDVEAPPVTIEASEVEMAPYNKYNLEPSSPTLIFDYQRMIDVKERDEDDVSHKVAMGYRPL